MVKIIRNQSINSGTLSWDDKEASVGSSTTNNGSNDWSDSQLMLMLNGTNYLKTGYDVNNTKLHNSYTITNNMVADGNEYNFYNATYSYLDGNGTAVYVPSQATTSSYTGASGSIDKKIESSALSKIATVKWYLYGSESYTTEVASAYYNKERNINSSGEVYTGATPEKRPVYWYGKIGLMYPSDYGYATNGGTTYDRNTCLGYQMYGWNSGSYKTDCAGGSFLWYTGITSTAPGTSGTNQWTLSPRSGYADIALYVGVSGRVVGDSTANLPLGVRPVLYLKADTTITGGTGTYNNPYKIGSPEPLQYWTAYGHGSKTFPDHNEFLSSFSNYAFGQDSEKYYVCLDYKGKNACISQPYTQYGLDGHILNNDFTVTEQTSGTNALLQVFNLAGISPSLVTCGTSSSTIYCRIGKNTLNIKNSGVVTVFNSDDYSTFTVYQDGTVTYYN